MSIAGWSRPLCVVTISQMSQTGGRDVGVAICSCGIFVTSQTSHVYKHRILPSRSIMRRHLGHKFDYYWDIYWIIWLPVVESMPKTLRGSIQVWESSTWDFGGISLGLNPRGIFAPHLSDPDNKVHGTSIRPTRVLSAPWTLLSGEIHRPASSREVSSAILAYEA